MTLSGIIRLLISILIVSLFPVGLLAQDETVLIPIAIGEEATGTIDGVADVYVFSATAGQTLIVDVISDEFEPVVEVDGPDGFGVAFEFGGDTFASAVFTAQVDGEYTALAGEFMGAGTGSYTFRVREAETLTVAEPVSGSVNSNTAAYTFRGTEGTLTVLKLEASGLDLELELMDSEGNTLASRVLFSSSSEVVLEHLLPADGAYIATVPLWFATDNLEGDFTLTLNEIQPTSIVYDVASTIELVEFERQYFYFEGAAGDVIHLTADSGTTADVTGIDTNLELLNPDGSALSSDSSDGPYSDPAITRIILPMDGLYLVKLIPDQYGSGAGSVALLVETAELLRAEDGTLSMTLGERFEQDYVYYDAQPGQQYRLTVVPDRAKVSFNVAVGEGLFGGTNVTVVDGDGLIFYFTVPADSKAGLAGVSLRQSSYQNPTVYQITLEPVE